MMKAKALRVIILSCLVWTSCKTSTTSKCGPCPLYAEVAPFIDVRIVDKTTGADLFLSPNSPYKPTELQVNSSVDGPGINVFVDSTQKDNRFIKILATTTQTFTLKLASLSADSIRVVLKRDSPKCCPISKISSIMLNTAQICAPCNFSQTVTIKK